MFGVSLVENREHGKVSLSSTLSSINSSWVGGAVHLELQKSSSLEPV
uniref:Uncharacterized protein n=1 Tax=Utricularia reniformis TaxID=192314 RepID=A0A1Y0B0K5_9LAMI|nr:hypothetical protein AEK19_MT0681 [Utricularia reniformis]ART30929.1 hypothetical protein AEK19_MT0681 [Utricularia reniformis]